MVGFRSAALPVDRSVLRVVCWFASLLVGLLVGGRWGRRLVAVVIVVVVEVFNFGVIAMNFQAQGTDAS